MKNLPKFTVLALSVAMVACGRAPDDVTDSAGSPASEPVAAAARSAPPVLADASRCDAAPACVDELRRRAQAGKQMDMDWAEHVGSRDGAVALLVPLLADPDARVAEYAGLALRDAPAIDPKYLPEIRAGLDRGLGWLPPALARIPSDDAAREAVSRYLVSESAPHNQEAYAVSQSGARAIPHIVAAAKCTPTCVDHVHYYLGSALMEMEEVGAAALPGLLEIIEDPRTKEPVLEGVVGMIGQLGKHARGAEPALMALRTRQPSLASMIDFNLVRIGASGTVRILVGRLQADPGAHTLSSIARAGRDAHDAGPAVRPLLRDPDWRLRAMAVRTLGMIGYRPAIADLVPLLEDRENIQLVAAATEALGDLRALEAKADLARLQRTHWHPGIRALAAEALAMLPQPAAEASKERGYSVTRPESIAAELCEHPRVQRVPPLPVGRLDAPRDAARLETLDYAASEFGFGVPPPPPELLGTDPLGPKEVPRHTPHVAIPVAGGWLAASDRGEWGGEIVFVADDGKDYGVLDENTSDLHLLGDSIVAVTGLGHMGINRAGLYRLERGADGKWRAIAWRGLPAPPGQSYLVAGGELMVETYEGGSVLVAADGTMRMAPCADGEPK